MFPRDNGNTARNGPGKIVRFDLSTFGNVSVLDLQETDNMLGGFYGGFSDGTYGYTIPTGAGASSPTGKVPEKARWGLLDGVEPF